MEKINELKCVCDILQNQNTALTREIEDYCNMVRQLQQRVKCLTEKVPPFLHLTVHVDEDAAMLERTAIITSWVKKSRNQIRFFVTKLHGMHRDIARLDSREEAGRRERDDDEGGNSPNLSCQETVTDNDDVPAAVCCVSQCEKNVKKM
ncbi:uncharacterized protein LOC112451756 [Temnothorax curvispinosus]|uniref:Uncharacterized protein LOC112451756 n=2 Tax=Temnothorax curvispinosus TaxID=300111 RepID=A0A6J1PD23_9HYME|nr:uncharacterized protein LOC112451756 [Temnothorax curvispinosus]